MIHAKLSDSQQYESLHPLLKPLFDYIRATDWSQVPTGRITLKGDELFINVDEGMMKSKEEQLVEVHRKYIDVQVPLSCTETMGWQPADTLQTEPTVPYDEQTDRAFYQQPMQHYAVVEPGEFTIFFPSDAHAPMIGNGKCKKFIAKLKI